MLVLRCDFTLLLQQPYLSDERSISLGQTIRDLEKLVSAEEDILNRRIMVLESTVQELYIQLADSQKKADSLITIPGARRLIL